MRFISLFAGIGGFDKGLEDSGHTCVAQVEKDAAALSVLAYQWPSVPRFDDVRTVGAHNLPACDLIVGGFPCQDLSVAGQRAGLVGERSGLFYEMTRIVDELRPAFLLWENVPGLLSSRRGADFAAVLMELERIGYSGCWTTLDAQFFGVAQRRQRVFGLFARRDIGAARCAEILALADRLPWNLATRPQARTRVAASLTAGTSATRGVNAPGRRREDDYNLVACETAQTLTVGANQTYGFSGDDVTTKAPAIAQSNRGADTGETFETLRAGSHGALPMVARAPLAHAQRLDGESETFITGVASALSASHGGADDNDAQAHHIVAFTERTRAEGRTLEAQEDLACALTNPGSGGRTHSRQIAGGFGVRRLTPTECERLQGFPDGWTAQGVNGPQADSARYRQLGNAVCVNVARWLGWRLKEAH